jgi:prolyl oligopeptidase
MSNRYPSMISTAQRICLLLLVLLPVHVSADADGDFVALLGEAWEWQLAADPMFASRLGDRRYNRKWRDDSVEAIEARDQDTRDFLQRLLDIDSAALRSDNQLNYELFRRQLTNAVERQKFGGHLLPFSHRGGIQNLESRADLLRFETADDYRDWLARMAEIDTLVDQQIELAEAGIRAGLVAPRALAERIPAQVSAQLVKSPEESPFFDLFETLPDSLDAAEREGLREDALKTIKRTILPAYKRFSSWYERVYLPAARETIGLSALPDGREWYEFLARYYTTTEMTPDEIHRLGLDEVKRIRDQMMEVIAEVGFEGDFAAFLEFLRTDSRFYFDDAESLYNAYLATSKRIDPELVRLFGKLPRVPYGVRPIPDAIAPDTTTAYYTRPAADGTRAGIYWVNLYRPEVRPRYEIEVLSVHEAMPGHHLQLALQQELADLPNFRRYSGFTAFTEGWGLYSESLGYDLGLYTDPYSRFGALTYDMWRAVRLVVDTGIHYKGWTRDQAIDFFKANAAKTEHDIVNEIDRYIGNPGQALAYKIGQLKMLELRRDAETRLGDTFDIRAFHDELLGAGALPLDLLESRMNDWISSQL